MDQLRRPFQLLTACVWLAVACALPGCGRPGPETPGSPVTTDTPAAGQDGAPVVTTPVSVPERFQTEPTAADLDSIGIWHGPDASWLVVTSKAEHALYVYDAATGAPVTRVHGDFRRPNGVVVAGDLVFVVERDNHRVHLLHAPDFETIRTFGEDLLARPYGIAVERETPDTYTLWVTDNYETDDETTPPDTELDRRVHKFVISLDTGTLDTSYLGAFGGTEGPGILHTVESIHADPDERVLLVADESRVDVKAYTFDGRHDGRTLGAGVLRFEPEGIALARCGGGGAWIVTDQHETANAFHLFDRKTFRHVGAFSGPATSNTDGVALADAPLPGFPDGAFYAIDDDSRVSAFDWAAIAAALRLPDSCPPTP